MEEATLFGALTALTEGLLWLVMLAGAILALTVFVRTHRNAALLALLGFGLPVFTIPLFALLRWFLAQRLGLPGLLSLNVLGGLSGLASAGLLVAAFWLAFRQQS